MTSYVQPPEFHVLERDGQYLYLDPVNHVWFATDGYGSAALRGFSKNQLVGDAISELASFSGLSEDNDDVADYVNGFLSGLVEIGFLHDDKYVAKDLFGVKPEYPVVMYLHLTNSCNLACSYCYNQEHRQTMIDKSSIPVKHERLGTLELSERFKSVISQARELGVREVKLTGGEATLFKEYLSVARHAKSLGMRVNLMTNGAGITKDKAKEVVECVDSVSISIDSRLEIKHDLVRGRGSHARALNAVRHLRLAGLKHLHLNGVVTPGTVGDAFDLLSYATENLMADSVTLSPSSMKVRDPEDRWGASDQTLTASEFAQVDKAQYAFAKQQNAAPSSVPYRNHCGVGEGVVSIDPNGDVYPCQTLHEKDFMCGNAFDNSLKSVLDQSAVTALMKSTTVDSIEECNVCPVRYICHSGCRAEAYTREGKFNVRNVDSCPSFYATSVNSLWDSVQQVS